MNNVCDERTNSKFSTQMFRSLLSDF